MTRLARNPQLSIGVGDVVAALEDHMNAKIHASSQRRPRWWDFFRAQDLGYFVKPAGRLDSMNLDKQGQCHEKTQILDLTQVWYHEQIINEPDLMKLRGIGMKPQALSCMVQADVCESASLIECHFELGLRRRGQYSLTKSPKESMRTVKN